ncbi:extracellular serine/threonine protein kinase four-jointed [Dermacentor andersoni]|uniref:extracellular serine/threonine protein kinase four-jointed n=1 Tax=Dermacentor andersoni TaxID=34620 RepID=UPI0021558152|nr:extracellular serine/threonine protein kinase four-jointed-like [Dermacentor andersoni]
MDAAMRWRRTWLATAGLAFCLGMTVGLLLPLRELARSGNNSSSKAEAGSQHERPGNASSSGPPPPPTGSAAAASRALNGSDLSLLPRRSEKGTVRGIFWAGPAERLVAAGSLASEEDVSRWRATARRSTVRAVYEGCGRMQNRLIVFDTGVLSCARYRQNNDQIQGELFSFYLSRELGIRNLPSALLTRAAGRSWDPVRSSLELAQWRSDRPVVLTKFVDDLVPTFIPEEFRSPTTRRLHPPDVVNKTQKEIRDLIQWSDLIVFDYLTANLDRIVNNMFNLQWNPDMMNAPAHNLVRQKTTGLLVFLDNESGLVHGYRLLDKYEVFHRSLLDSLCVFRKGTADAVARLTRDRDIGRRLYSAFNSSDPGMDNYLPFLPERSVKILNKRLAQVNAQIRRCMDKYGHVLR